MTGRLLLAGYGGTAPRAFFDSVAASGADLAVDIRYNPWSPIDPYRGSRFLANLRAAGVPNATHRHDLGNRAYKTGGTDVPESGIEWLRERLIEGQQVAIICACRESTDCHRRHIADRLVEQLPDLSIVEL